MNQGSAVYGRAGKGSWRRISRSDGDVTCYDGLAMHLLVISRRIDTPSSLFGNCWRPETRLSAEAYVPSSLLVMAFSISLLSQASFTISRSLLPLPTIHFNPAPIRRTLVTHLLSSPTRSISLFSLLPSLIPQSTIRFNPAVTRRTLVTHSLSSSTRSISLFSLLPSFRSEMSRNPLTYDDGPLVWVRPLLSHSQQY